MKTKLCRFLSNLEIDSVNLPKPGKRKQVQNMAKEGGVPKYDANTEAFQMRAQWKKTEICRKQWYERWSWLLDEHK